MAKMHKRINKALTSHLNCLSCTDFIIWKIYKLAKTTRKETPRLPTVSAICISPILRYWLYPKSAQGKPVNRWQRIYSKTTQMQDKKIIIGKLKSGILLLKPTKKYPKKAK